MLRITQTLSSGMSCVCESGRGDQMGKVHRTRHVLLYFVPHLDRRKRKVDMMAPKDWGHNVLKGETRTVTNRGAAEASAGEVLLKSDNILEAEPNTRLLASPVYNRPTGFI